MTALLVAAAIVLGIASLAYWLPKVIIALRMRLFLRLGGGNGISIPSDLVDAAHFKEVYAHPAANGRSRGAALSDLFWYWLSPGAELYQEHLEPGEQYEEVARATQRFLAMPSSVAEELATRCASHVLDEQRPSLVRLRDLWLPVWAEFYYAVVFGKRCPRRVRDLIVANADDVATALKWCGLRHMARRHRLTDYLMKEAGLTAQPLPSRLMDRERALYLQSTFFTTAVVQMSEAMAHLCMVLALRPDVQARVAAEDDAYLDRVIQETFRQYPLFGVAHRITSARITVNERVVLPAGSMLCFNYPSYHRAGSEDADRFDPDRWERISVREAYHVPFGVAANRPCPAWRIAPITMRAAVREMLRRFTLHSSASHTRSMPNRGPCLLEPRQGLPHARRASLVYIWARDRCEDVVRSVVQLILGTYMVIDARRLRLCERYFAKEGS